MYLSYLHIASGEKINYKKIAADALVSYNTVRRHARAIIDELTRERDAEKVETAGA